MSSERLSESFVLHNVFQKR